MSSYIGPAAALNKISLYLSLTDTLSSNLFHASHLFSYSSSFSERVTDIVNLLIKIKNFLLLIMKKRLIFHFKTTDYDIVNSWLVKHVRHFQHDNIFSITDSTALLNYQKQNNIQQLQTIEPRKLSQIYLLNTEVTYLLTNTSITFYHFNKMILQSTLSNLLSAFNQVDELKQEKYTPKIYKFKKQVDENKQIQISWVLENVLYENVKLFLNEEDKDRILSPFQDFKEKRELYNKIGLCYKLVSCFHGGAGLGKTTTVKYIAQTFSKNIYMFTDLDLTQEMLLSLIQQIPENSIMLFDDFDKFNVPISRFRSTILNLLDGVLTKYGSLIIFCLNDPMFLERTIPTITRPGRIDNFIDFNLVNRNIHAAVIKDIYSYGLEEAETYIKLIEERPVLPSMAELKNDCLIAGGDIKQAILFELKKKVIRLEQEQQDLITSDSEEED